jgi:tellurite methyltransferase
LEDRYNVENNKKYWDLFYQKNHKYTPSQFCVCLLTEINPDAVIVELGSGNGRDSHYFASQGHFTVAVDLSEQAIKSCEDIAKSRNIHHSTFFQGDITNREFMHKAIEHARVKSGGREVVFYSRFVMHSMDANQESYFLKILFDLMQMNEVVYFEFRSEEDSELKKHFSGHFRRFIETDNFKKILTNKLNFAIDYSITGRGMAKFKEEDPMVSRIIARKK